MYNRNKGFTLIELLIIIGIIGFLAAAILVAVDPVRRIQEARDAKRWAEVNGILNAILTKQVDDKEYFDGASTAPVISSDDKAQVIISAEDLLVGARLCNGLNKPTCAGLPVGITLDTSGADKKCVANLHDAVTPANSLDPTYIASIPVEPHGAGWDPDGAGGDTPAIGTNNTGYYIHRRTSNRIEIGSCWAEQTATAPKGISTMR